MSKTSSSRGHRKKDTAMVLQILPRRYLDEKKLDALLEKTFGGGKYKMQFKAEEWSIKAPRALTVDEIQSVEQEGQY